MSVQLEESWKKRLEGEFRKDYMINLKAFLSREKQEGRIIYPPSPQIFNAFNLCPFDEVKVVIIGQDPYHGAGQAHGLSFSVLEGVKPPPSLRNIFQELEKDIPGFRIPQHGNLTHWARQGVLLLNATLTVRQSEAASHHNRGWERFTDKAIELLSSEREGLIFLLWGRNAQAKEALIDAARHHIFKAAHPSPFSAYNGFFGCAHFSKANAILKERGEDAIDWQI